ncbi:MAG: TlpA family protein disulfide reductase [Myxococcota bacterium]
MVGESQSTQRSFVLVAALVVVAFIVVAVWQAVRSSGPESRTRELMPAVGAQVVDRPAPEGMMQFPLEPPPGAAEEQPVRLADYPKDTLIFLNFWATWCKPCVQEIPSMLRLAREVEGQRFAMLAVSYDDSWGDIRSFFERFQGGLPPELHLVRDPHTEEAETMRSGFGTRKLPETYLIRNGQVLARFVNARDWTDPAMVEFFQQLLRAP